MLITSEINNNSIAIKNVPFQPDPQILKANVVVSIHLMITLYEQAGYLQSSGKR